MTRLTDDGDISEDEPPGTTLTSTTQKNDRTLEDIRGEALRWVMVILAAVTGLAAVATFFNDAQWQHMKEFIGLVYTGLLGIAGTVLGYYFGRGDSRSRRH